MRFAKNLIRILDERAGPMFVDDRSTSSSRSNLTISPVEHEVEQCDASFAKDYKYTTNVSKSIRVIEYLKKCSSLHVFVFFFIFT